MANPHKLWMMVGTVGAITGLYDLFKRTPAEQLPAEDNELEESEPVSDIRAKVVSYAESHEGSSDSDYFWSDALDSGPPYPKDWCGAFVLSSLHSAGLATDRRWAVGLGLEATLPKLERTTDPKPGDIAYFTAKQHVAIVLHVDGNEVSLANGNSTGNKVVLNVKPKSAVTTFYSIQPYVDALEGVT
jgi:hypothetical protein